MSNQAAAEPPYTVHYQHDVYDKRPLVDPCLCCHSGPAALPIGFRVERVRGRNQMAYDAIVCLDCGADGTGQMDLVDGLTEAYREGMNRLARCVVMRVYDLVEHRRADLEGQPIPLWMAHPLGMSRDDINEAVRNARVHRAAEYMAARVARYAEAA